MIIKKSYKNYLFLINMKTNYSYGYVKVAPDQEGYHYNHDDLQEFDDNLTKLVIDKKDKNKNRLIGFNTKDTRDDPFTPNLFTNWTKQKLIYQCKIIIDALSSYHYDVIAENVSSIISDLKFREQLIDIDVDFVKSIDKILNSKASHHVVELFKQAVADDGIEKSDDKALDALNRCLMQNKINVFEIIRDYN